MRIKNFLIMSREFLNLVKVRTSIQFNLRGRVMSVYTMSLKVILPFDFSTIHFFINC